MKALLYTLMAAITAISCSVTPSVPANEFLIEGKVENVPDDTILHLCKLEGNVGSPLQTDTIIQNKFLFRDTISTLREVTLISSSKGFPYKWRNVWIAPGQYIAINGQDKLLPLWEVQSNIPEQKEENTYALCAIKEQREVLTQEIKERKLLNKIDRQDNNAQQVRSYWQQIDSLRKIYQPIKNLLSASSISFHKT